MAKSRQQRARDAIKQIRLADKLSRGATSRPEKVEAAITKIRAFHELGQHLPPRQGHRDVYGRGIIDGEAERLHVSPDTLRKARVFADRVEGYTRKELNELCRLIQKVQPGQDEALAILERSHLVRLLSVRSKVKRAALQEECIRSGWSTAELDTEIAKRFGTRRAGGRRRKIPLDLTDFLIQMELNCEQWRRWKEELSRDPEEVIAKHICQATIILPA